jgi:DNA modification methylase
VEQFWETYSAVRNIILELTFTSTSFALALPQPMLEQILTGDCRDILPTLEPESVQCCVTSPPYWGLRDYGTGQWEGGGEGCDHKHDRKLADWSSSGLQRNKVSPELSAGTIALVNHQQEAHYRDVCGKCGARRIDSQLGLESTPEEYIAKMVAVFREVWRVLRDDGTLWLNFGDSYAAGKQGRSDPDRGLRHTDGRNPLTQSVYDVPIAKQRSAPPGLKPKDLVGIPWRMAFALQADGWYLRSDIIWHKPNPMPESVTDRPTKAHEYIFLLTKAERYFYDAEAIREPDSGLRTSGRPHPEKAIGPQYRNGHSQWERRLSDNQESGRNKRSVWTIATQPYSEAHFATFPEEIPKLCILAGSKLGDTILDPFAGSGTTGKVALELGRKAILIELNPAYIELARARTFTTPGFL